MANEFHIRVIKLAKYEELRPAAYGVIGIPRLVNKLIMLIPAR